MTGVRHRCPRLLRRQRRARLKQLDRDIVGRPDEGHVAVARRPVDRDAIVHQPPAGVVDILHPVGDVAEIAAFGISLLIPIMGELNLGVLVAGRGEEDQGEAALLIVHSAQLAKAEQLEEAKRLLWVGDPDHRVQISHCGCLSSSL